LLSVCHPMAFHVYSREGKSINKKNGWVLHAFKFAIQT
jgi:hypothetical protein